MPLVWLLLCLVIWLVPMEPATSHTFGLLAQVSVAAGVMIVVVVVVVVVV